MGNKESISEYGNCCTAVEIPGSDCLYERGKKSEIAYSSYVFRPWLQDSTSILRSIHYRRSVGCPKFHFHSSKISAMTLYRQHHCNLRPTSQTYRHSCLNEQVNQPQIENMYCPFLIDPILLSASFYSVSVYTLVSRCRSVKLRHRSAVLHFRVLNICPCLRSVRSTCQQRRSLYLAIMPTSDQLPISLPLAALP